MSLKAKDIAKILDISPSTVSMVLNNKPGISDNRRQQIIKKINELGCGHLLKKIGTASGKNIGFVVYKTIGVIIDESPFFSLIIEGVNVQARKYGYNLMMIHIDRNMLVDECVKQVRDCHCDGLIIFGVEMFSADVALFRNIGLPFVIVDNYFVDEDVDTVSINNKQGVRKSVKHLTELGHRKIGYIKSNEIINSFSERYETYLGILRELGLEFDERYVFPLQYSENGSYLDMKRFLDEGRKLPSALVADNDLLAFSAMKAIQESGYRIPDDVSIIGFDDRPICLLSDPQMTTVLVPKDSFGPASVDLLVSRFENPQKNCFRIEIGVELIQRGSVSEWKDTLWK